MRTEDFHSFSEPFRCVEQVIKGMYKSDFKKNIEMNSS